MLHQIVIYDAVSKPLHSTVCVTQAAMHENIQGHNKNFLNRDATEHTIQ